MFVFVLMFCISNDGQVCEITPDTRHYFDKYIPVRLNKMNGYMNQASGVTSIHVLKPSITCWGDGRSHGFRSDAIRCSNGKPIRLWVVAEVVANLLVSKEGNAVPTPSIKFRPVLDCDFDAMKALVTKFCFPMKCEFSAFCVVKYGAHFRSWTT